MAISPEIIDQLCAPIPSEYIKVRPGPGGRKFSYISTDFVIRLLNKAFQGAWENRIFHHDIVNDTVIVGMELSVLDQANNYIVKQQFGSCEIQRGMSVGDAFKGAASDALKKCATLLGVGLNLYGDDIAFDSPVRGLPESRGTTSSPPAFNKPPAQSGAGVPPTPVQRPIPVPNKATGARPASPKPIQGIPRPAAANAPRPTAPGLAAPKGAQAAANVPRPSRVNPFARTAAAGEGQVAGPSTPQINAMTNLAARKKLSPAELIAAAGIVDEVGNPVESFEELTREQAIQVIKAAQQL